MVDNFTKKNLNSCLEDLLLQNFIEHSSSNLNFYSFIFQKLLGYIFIYIHINSKVNSFLKTCKTVQCMNLLTNRCQQEDIKKYYKSRLVMYRTHYLGPDPAGYCHFCLISGSGRILTEIRQIRIYLVKKSIQKSIFSKTNPV